MKANDDLKTLIKRRDQIQQNIELEYHWSANRKLRAELREVKDEIAANLAAPVINKL